MSTNGKLTSDRDDAELVHTIQHAYSAPELTPSRRAAIDARVWERVEGRRRFRFVGGMALSAALAASLVVVIRSGRITTQPEPAPATVAAVALPHAVSDPAFADAMLSDLTGDDGSRDHLDELPDDYRAITDVLLEG